MDLIRKLTGETAAEYPARVSTPLRLAVAGAMPPQLKPQVLAYEPIPQWATGNGVMAWTAV